MRKMQEFDLYLALDYNWYPENVSNLAHWIVIKFLRFRILMLYTYKNLPLKNDKKKFYGPCHWCTFNFFFGKLYSKLHELVSDVTNLY